MAYFRCTVGGSGKGNTVVVTCASEFAGETITLSKTGKTYTKTCPSSSPYTVTYYGVENGTYTVSATVDGQTYSETVVVQDITAELLFGFTWQTWVDASVDLDSTDYSTLADVLVDEKAVRELFLVHDCVDYMASIASVNTDLATVINNDLCAKWINLSDYALDTLYANQAIATAMDTADKYGYGEWVIVDDTTTPPTWGPKGNVPVMTSNTAPYGEASASSTYSGYSPYFAFNGTVGASQAWHSVKNATNVYLRYKHTNPLKAKRLRITYDNNSASTSATCIGTLQGSNDGSTWESIKEFTLYGNATASEYKTVNFDLENDNYYLYYQLFFPSGTFIGSAYWALGIVQFYGRELKVSVPKMDTNTTPYGEVSSTTPINSNAAWKAFDKVSDSRNSRNLWETNNIEDNPWIQYEFPAKTIVKKVLLENLYDGSQSYISKFEILASNDEQIFENLGEFNCSSGNNLVSVFDISNDTEYKYYRLRTLEAYRAGNLETQYAVLAELNFYGLDYSEKEFANDGSKWLYDHGVELETMSLFDISASNWQGSSITKNDSFIEVKSGNVSAATGGVASPKVNLSLYDLIRAKICGAILVNTNARVGLTINDQYDSSIDAWSVYQSGNGNLPNNLALDVSSVNTEDYVVFYVPYGVSSAPGTPLVADLSELWLEP